MLLRRKNRNPKIAHLKYKARGSIFLTYLLRFNRLGNVVKMNEKEMEENLRIPKDIASHLLNTYATVSLAKGSSEKKFHHVRSKKLKDKLLSHIIVLMVLIRDYKIDVKILISALRIDFLPLVSFLRMISCFPKKSRNKKEEPEDGVKEEKKRKSEWALDSKGSLMVYLKAPMRFQKKK